MPALLLWQIVLLAVQGAGVVIEGQVLSDLVASFGLKGKQIPAVSHRGCDLAVTAGAGSGKTKTLVARYLSLLDEGLLPGEIVAVTFTEKAAREMRNRIRAAIGQWTQGGCPSERRSRWREVAADIDAAPIGTIHGLCASLLRAHPAEAGTDPRAAVLDDGIAAALRATAVDDALAWAAGQDDLAPLFASFDVLELERITAGLLHARLDIRFATSSCATGEEWHRAVMAEMERYTGHDQAVLAIGHLATLRDRGLLHAEAGDALAVQVEGLLAEWDVLRRHLHAGEATPAASTLCRLRREHLAGNTGRKASSPKEAVKTLRDLYDRLVGPWLGSGRDGPPDGDFEARAAAAASLLGLLFHQANERYQRAKDYRQAVDFDDLEWHAARLLEIPEVRLRWQRKIKAILVDEFQDTNERQRQIVEALAGDRGGDGRLFVVGDAKQSIYRFRGADVTVFRRLEGDVKARGGKVIELDTTFRGHEALVGALNEILCALMGDADDPSEGYRVPFSPLIADRHQPRAGIKEPFVELLYGQGESTEESRHAAARMLSGRLIHLRETEDVRWQDVALLFRAATAFPVYETALEEAGIPFATVAGKGFYDRPEISDILNMLRALADPSDDLAMAGLLRSPAFGLSDAALYQLRWPASEEAQTKPIPFQTALAVNLGQLAERDRAYAERARRTIDELAGLVDRVAVADLIKQLLDKTLYQAVLASAPHGARLNRNIDKLLADAGKSGLVSVAEFLRYFETIREAGAREGEAPAEAGACVRLMTVHKAKGLEFPIVVIADASHLPPNIRGPALISHRFGPVPCPRRWKQKPLVYGLAKALETAQEEAEDLRTLYVAATRAREKLLVCGHQVRGLPRTWFGKLATAAGHDLDQIDDRVVTLPMSRQQVALLVELPPRASNGTADPVTEVEPQMTSSPTPLYHPIVTQLADDSQAAKAERARFGERHDTDGKIVGRLVHEAIRRWKFPADPTMAQILRAAAYSADLAEPEEVARHVHWASTLLARLRADSAWPDLDKAERHHEVPFSIAFEHGPKSGEIDLLYRPLAGDPAVWHIVDFKTDELNDLLDSRVDVYRAQIRSYRHAVERILGCQVKTTLCFLDLRGGVHWQPVE